MFVSVVEAGSFAEAARRLGVPPNTLSRRIQWLERRLAVRLMQRSTRKLCLTDAGRRFFEKCSGSVREISLAGKQMVENTEVPAGSFRIATPTGFFNSRWVSEFLAEHDQVKFEFTLSDVSIDLIAEGIDLAFREGRLPDSSLVARKIDSAYGILVASPCYLRARGMPCGLESLSHHDCIIMSPSIARSGWSLTGPKGCVEISPRGRLSVNTHQAMISTAMTGAGIALVPAMLAVDLLQEGRLVHVLPEYRRENVGLYAVFPSRHHAPLAISLFVDFVAQRLSRFWLERHWAVELLTNDPRKLSLDHPD